MWREQAVAAMCIWQQAARASCPNDITVRASSFGLMRRVASLRKAPQSGRRFASQVSRRSKHPPLAVGYVADDHRGAFTVRCIDSGQQRILHLLGMRESFLHRAREAAVVDEDVRPAVDHNLQGIPRLLVN